MRKNENLKCEVEKIIKLLLSLYNLKNIPRSGYIVASLLPPTLVPNVGIHTLLVAYISFLVSESIAKSGGVKIDMEKVFKLALLHDIHELIITDLPNGPTFNGILQSANVNKTAIEKSAGEKILTLFPDSLKREILSVFDEYHEKKSLETKIVSIADQIAVLFEILELKRCGADHPWLDVIWKVKIEEIRKNLNKISNDALMYIIYQIIDVLQKIKTKEERYLHLLSPYLGKWFFSQVTNNDKEK